MMHESNAPLISRRNLLGGAAVLGLASVGMLAGCSPNGKTGNAEATTEETYDIVIVGSGLSGLCAGIRSLEHGLSVLIVEKGTNVATPSNSILSGGALNMPNDDSEESIQAFIDIYDSKSKGKGDSDITRLIAENIQADLDWLTSSHGVELNDPIPNTPFNCLKTYAAPGASQGMGTLMTTLAQEYENLGGSSLCDTKMIDLALDDAGAVCGVKVRDKKGVSTISAKKTIIASGGYIGNRELLETFVGEDADEIMNRGQAHITGDGLLAASRAGAMLRQMGGQSSLHIGAVHPDNVASGNPSNAIGYTLAINTLGMRYCDESKGYVTHGKALMSQPDQVAALVFDENIKQLEQVQMDIERFASFKSAPVEAATLEELADLIAVPAGALRATVEEFNAHIVDDHTEGLAFDKASQAMKIESSKFYAFYPLKPGSIMGFGGIYTNANTEVLEADGTPIKNLHVVGEAMGGVFAYDYLGGASLNRAIVTGARAADLIAEQLQA